MVLDDCLSDDPRALTPEIFELVVTNELKRAIRSQNFLTLLIMEPTAPSAESERPALARELARIVGRVVRETDILSPERDGRLAVVLLDTDFDSSMQVVGRLMTWIEHYQFRTPASFSIGAASCPRDGVDLVSLRSAAASRSAQPRRAPRGSSNAQ
jgi:hypothetical protein